MTHVSFLTPLKWLNRRPHVSPRRVRQGNRAKPIYDVSEADGVQVGERRAIQTTAADLRAGENRLVD